MTARPTTVLVVGATGSIGRLVVEEATRHGYATRALARDPEKARRLLPEAEVIVGDVTRSETLSPAVDGVDAVVFTLGSDGAGKVGAESVDYGGVRNVLNAFGSRTARVALMTSIGVTNRAGAYNRSTEAHDWKRRSERLVRASGMPYTIVRPGWFDYNGPDEHRLVLLQGDTRQAGDPSDGVIARRQIAEILVRSLGWTKRCARLSSSSRRPVRPRRTSTHCSRRWKRTHAARSTAYTTQRTCRWTTSRSGCATTWTRSPRADPRERRERLHGPPGAGGHAWQMSSAEIHREPFVHLVDLGRDRALIAWGAFYFERTERSRWEIVDDEQLPGRVGRRTCIGATAEPFGNATVQVLTRDGKVAAEASTDERAWVWLHGLEPETDYRYRVEVDGEEWAAGELWDWVPSERGGYDLAARRAALRPAIPYLAAPRQPNAAGSLRGHGGLRGRGAGRRGVQPPPAAHRRRARTARC